LTVFVSLSLHWRKLVKKYELDFIVFFWFSFSQETIQQDNRYAITLSIFLNCIRSTCVSNYGENGKQ